MTIYTELQLTATPGRQHSFLPKGVPSGTHTGQFTTLSVTATPGQRRSFLPKTEAVIRHQGLFTELSVIAMPGKRHSFLAKNETIPVIEPIIPVVEPSRGGSGGWIGIRPKELDLKQRQRTDAILRDDQEFLEILSMIAPIILR